MSEHDLPIEFRDEHGDLIEPPEGVSYGGSYTALPDSPAILDHSGSHACSLCAASDWAWALKIRPATGAASLAWPASLVACAPCFQLYRADDITGLRQRILDEDDPFDVLEHLDELLDRIVRAERRR